MRRTTATLLLIGALSAGTPHPGQSSADGPGLDWLEELVRLDDGDWREVRAGRTVARTMPAGSDADHLVVVMAGRTTATPEGFAAGVKNSAQLWRGARVPRSGTFGMPLSTGHVAEMVMSPENLRAIRSCRPGDCDIKLAPAEMARLQQQLQVTDRPWEEAVQREFRAIVLDRLEGYRRRGLASISHLHDHERPVDLQAVFDSLFTSTPALSRHAPALAGYIERYPHRPLPDGVEEVQYWLQTSETPKPTIQAVHAVIHRAPAGGPIEVLVVSRQIFATHYVNGTLAISALIRDAQDPSQRYLVYVNRSAVDGLVGFFSGLRRFVIERRVRGAARGAFDHLRRELER